MSLIIVRVSYPIPSPHDISKLLAERYEKAFNEQKQNLHHDPMTRSFFEKLPKGKKEPDFIKKERYYLLHRAYIRALAGAFGQPHADLLLTKDEERYPDFYHYINSAFIYRNDHLELQQNTLAPLRKKDPSPDRKPSGMYLLYKPNAFLEYSFETDIRRRFNAYRQKKAPLWGNMPAAPTVPDLKNILTKIELSTSDGGPYENPATQLYAASPPSLSVIPHYKPAASVAAKPNIPKDKLNHAVAFPAASYPQRIDPSTYPIEKFLYYQEYIHRIHENRPARNNNPGDLRFNHQTHASPELESNDFVPFAVFSNKEDGVEALREQLLLYNQYRPDHDYQIPHKLPNGKTVMKTTHMLDTIYDLLNVFAPLIENDTEGYIKRVANAMHVTPQQNFGRLNNQQLAVMMKEITRNEGIKNGSFDSLIDKIAARPIPQIESPPHSTMYDDIERKRVNQEAYQKQKEEAGLDMSFNFKQTTLH